MQSLHFYNWMRKIRALIQPFQGISFRHIYRIFNEEADSLSKESIGEMDGIIQFSKFVDVALVDAGQYSCFLIDWRHGLQVFTSSFVDRMSVKKILYIERNELDMSEEGFS